MKPVSDTSGQTSLDFIAGIAIFITAFLFVFTFIPGMLTPFQSDSDALTMTADRVGISLVDNRLTVSSTAHNVITIGNLNELRDKLNGPDYRATCESLGLNSTYRLYDLNITYTDMNGNHVECGPSFPQNYTNLGQSKRVVITDTGTIGTLYVMVW